jgi:hypothetical protein
MTLTVFAFFFGVSGMNNFQGNPPVVKNFTLQGNSSAIGISAVASINNPSLISIAIGDLDLELQYDGTKLALLTASNVTLNRGTNDLPTLVGSLQKSDSPTAYSDLFTTYVAKKSISAVCQGSPSTSSTQPSWLKVALAQ